MKMDRLHGLPQSHDRHPVPTFGLIAGEEFRHIGRILQMLAQDGFELAGSMLMNDPKG